MQYINLTQASEKWNISEDEVRKLCEKGEIEGVCRLCWGWAIPDDLEKPQEEE